MLEESVVYKPYASFGCGPLLLGITMLCHPAYYLFTNVQYTHPLLLAIAVGSNTLFVLISMVGLGLIMPGNTFTISDRKFVYRSLFSKVTIPFDEIVAVITITDPAARSRRQTLYAMGERAMIKMITPPGERGDGGKKISQILSALTPPSFDRQPACVRSVEMASRSIRLSILCRKLFYAAIYLIIFSIVASPLINDRFISIGMVFAASTLGPAGLLLAALTYAPAFNEKALRALCFNPVPAFKIDHNGLVRVIKLHQFPYSEFARAMFALAVGAGCGLLSPIDQGTRNWMQDEFIPYCEDEDLANKAKSLIQKANFPVL